MEEKPFFSIIIPTYNRRKELDGLLSCLKFLEYPADRFEIILVDDGSTDRTQEAFQDWDAPGAFRLVRQEHGGPGAARNRGAEIAQGEILVFTDSDCYPSEGWLSAFAEQYAKPWINPPAAVGGPILNIAGGNWLRKFQARRGIDHIANQQSSLLYLDTANMSILKTTFQAVGGFNPDYCWSEDIDLGFRLRQSGHRLMSTRKALVWHLGTRSISQYLKRSYHYGYAKVRLTMDYLDFFYPLPPPGARLSFRIWLEEKLRTASSLTFQTDKLSFLIFKLLYNLVQLLTWEKGFWMVLLPRQINLFKRQKLNLILIIFYLWLEWLCNLAHNAGTIRYYCLNIFPQREQDT